MMKRQLILRLHTELVVDNFAGGGGASTGMEWALGRSPDIAVNHDPEAIAMHAANHPQTRHLQESVWRVNPRKVTGGKPVALAWFSPDCKHFSRAKGGKPVARAIRGLAWVVVKWALAVRPRVILLENVPEFRDWGPLVNDRPCPERRGQTFARWKRMLEGAGYVVETRELVACDYGTPTSRKRLFVVARCDGHPIVWPKPSHGPRPAAPVRTAAECIDWSDLGVSIFERSKPLVEATLRRIARGMFRYVINAAEPFIVPVTHPGDARVYSTREPMRTVTGAHRGEFALVVPTLIQTGYGERPGQKPRTLDIQAPLGTVVGGGAKHALVAAFLARHYGGNENDGASVGRPMHTVTTQDHHALVTATLAEADHAEQVRAFLMAYYGTDQDPRLDRPLHTVTTRDRFALVTVAGRDYAITDIKMRMLKPRELFLAQGFPADYRIDCVPSKTAQIRMAGNAVCPQLSEALVRANCADLVTAKRRAA